MGSWRLQAGGSWLIPAVININGSMRGEWVNTEVSSYDWWLNVYILCYAVRVDACDFAGVKLQTPIMMCACGQSLGLSRCVGWVPGGNGHVGTHVCDLLLRSPLFFFFFWHSYAPSSRLTHAYALTVMSRHKGADTLCDKFIRSRWVSLDWPVVRSY